MIDGDNTLLFRTKTCEHSKHCLFYDGSDYSFNFKLITSALVSIQPSITRAAAATATLVFTHHMSTNHSLAHLSVWLRPLAGALSCPRTCLAERLQCRLVSGCTRLLLCGYDAGVASACVHWRPFNFQLFMSNYAVLVGC